jgi:hypothetical protein
MQNRNSPFGLAQTLSKSARPPSYTLLCSRKNETSAKETLPALPEQYLLDIRRKAVVFASD